jgi:hypothetical protein
VFIDHRTRSRWVQLYNPGTEAAEVSIEALFGYPVTDSIGQLELRTIEKPDSTFPSAVGWIQAFPRRTVIQPLARQTIRLLVTPPAGIADGEYWARLAITAKGSAHDGAAQQSPLFQPQCDHHPGLCKAGHQLAFRIRDSTRSSVRAVSRRAALPRCGHLINGATPAFTTPIGVYYGIDPGSRSVPQGSRPVAMLRFSVASDAPTSRPTDPPSDHVRDSIEVRIR